jgi:glycosyltransferase involved in cell wall biosynthesis
MRPQLLIVGTGAGGGIGRYELLVLRTLKDLETAGKLRYTAVWRRSHPSYLRTEDDSLTTETESIVAFSLRIWRIVRLGRPDIVMFTHVKLARLAPALSFAWPRPRVIVAAHGIEVWTRLSWPKRVALRLAARVVSVSTFTRERLIDEQGLPARKVVTIPLCLESSWLDSGIDPKRQGTLVTDSSAAPLTRLLTVSRLDITERLKGVDWVIRALPVVAQAVPDVSYAIVGEGDDVLRLRALASARGVMDRIAFKGALEHEELVREYNSCDVFVLPSAKEGFGLVFLEAMAFEKPVVARAAKATAEVIEDGETGVLISAEPELARALTELLLDRERASRMGAAGRRRLLEKFSLQRYQAQMWDLIHEVSADETRVAGRASNGGALGQR